MKINTTVLIGLLFLYKLSFSQDFDNYKSIKNTGTMPVEFTNFASEAYKQNVIAAKGKKNKEVKFKDEKAFLLESNFAITDLLRGGRILFNSPINEYINKVVDKLLESNPQLSKEIKVYVVQSSSVNAFTFNDGKIFINIGLLAHVGSEAQLAFILAHEISHYVKGHSFNIFVERKKIEKGVNEYEGLDESDKVFASNSYNKEQETEADAEALKLFAKTQYSMDEPKNALFMLHFAGKPFENKFLESNFISRAYMQLPKVYWPDTVDDYTIDDANLSTGDDEDTKKDDNSTHPSIDKRIRTLDKVNLGSNEREGGKMYLVSEKDFLATQKMARFELCRLYSLNYMPIENLYNVYLLEKSHPNSIYLAEAKLRSLYQIINAVNKGYRKSIITKPEKVDGEIKKLHHAFHNMTKEEISAICLRMAWDIKVKYKIGENNPNNDFLKSIVYSFANNISTKYSYFKGEKDYTDSLIQSWYVQQIDNQPIDKKGKKGKSKFKKTKNKGSFASYTMVPHLKTNEFKDYFLNVTDKIDEKTKEDEEAESEFEKTKASIKITKTKNLGIKKVVFLDPNYLVVDQRKKQSTRYIESEQKEIGFKNTILKCTDAAKIEADFIIPAEINNSEEYNEYALVRTRMIECFNNEDIKPLSTDNEAINRFAEKHNTEYVALLINLALTDQKDGGDILLGCLYSALTYGLYLPFFIYELSKPEKSNALILAVYNVKSGEIKYGNIKYAAERDSKDLLTSELYSLLIKLK
jgi:flagellar hook-basal body complex protein FliE